MKIQTENVDRVVLSHWHSDHSGGILAFLRLRQEAAAKARASGEKVNPCVVDLHPDRPIARGVAPMRGKIIGRLAPDPTFEEVEKLGGVVEKNAKGHAVAGGTVYVSGEIPRVTEYETGILGGQRWIGDVNTKEGQWVSEEVSSFEICTLITNKTDPG